jgi:hypothetical protein
MGSGQVFPALCHRWEALFGDEDVLVGSCCSSMPTPPGAGAGYPGYDVVEAALARQRAVCAPTVTFDALHDSNPPATDGDVRTGECGRSRPHRPVPSAGHGWSHEAEVPLCQCRFGPWSDGLVKSFDR